MNKIAMSMMSLRSRDINKSNEAIKHLLGKELSRDECDEAFYELLGGLIL